MKNIIAILVLGICISSPFSTIVTRDFLTAKKKEELDLTEARNRVQTAAILLTINEIGKQVNEYLKME